MFTRFFDVCSGGVTKERYNVIYIEAPREEAEIIFYNRFGHNPNRVSCTCCGSDYSITEKDELNSDSDDFYRNMAILVISADEIKPEEREGDLPQQGYVWMG